MKSHWATASLVIMPIEGIVGMVLNAALLYYLARMRVYPAARLYYISCIISGVCSFCTAFGIFLTVDTVVMVDGLVLEVLYGPLLFYLPRGMVDTVATAFVAQTHTTWEMLPAPAILQWLSLIKRERSKLSKIMTAYTVPLVLYIYGGYMMTHLIPNEQLRNRMVASASRLHGTNISDFHVYGVPIWDTGSFDAVSTALFVLLPSYGISYGLCALSAYKIRMRLRTIGSTTSNKTELMQRHFYRTQIAQVLAPLIVLSVPVVVFCGAALLGRELANYSILLCIFMWLTPVVTALLLLGFVRKAALSTTVSQKKDTQSQKESSAHAIPKSSSIIPLGPRQG